MKTFLVCEPTHFNVNYEINPWMVANIGKVDGEQALNQWNALIQILNNLNVEIKEINSRENLPDLVFTSNHAFVVNRHALLSNFSHPARQGEIPVMKDELKGLGLELHTECINENIFFEGADVLFHRKSNTLIIAHGYRTSIKAKSYIENFLAQVSPKTRILFVKLINPNYFNLNMCLNILDSGEVLYYPGAFTLEAIQKLYQCLGSKMISITDDDAAEFICDSISIGNHFITHQASPLLKEKLHHFGVNVIECPLDQFILSGGSAKSLTLELSLVI